MVPSEKVNDLTILVNFLLIATVVAQIPNMLKYLKMKSLNRCSTRLDKHFNHAGQPVGYIDDSLVCRDETLEIPLQLGLGRIR